MASADINAFELELTSQIARIAYAVALPSVARASRQLAAALSVIVDGPGRARLHIPHYWAKYLNEGRGAFGPSSAKVLVWFRNPGDDPRTPGGIYPVTENDIRRLTPDQFYEWLQKNREARARGELEPMIVAAYVGPAEGKRFFENDGGMAPLAVFLDQEVPGMVTEHIRAALGVDWHQTITETI